MESDNKEEDDERIQKILLIFQDFLHFYLDMPYTLVASIMTLNSEHVMMETCIVT
jgi:hypothetical protein